MGAAEATPAYKNNGKNFNIPAVVYFIMKNFDLYKLLIPQNVAHH
jgi:hypothetical protein